MKTFFKGFLLLVIAAFIGECLELIINLVLARQLGEMGMGLYMTILPSIFLVVIIASLELPISISKFIAEKEEQFHRSMMKHAAWLAIKITVILMAIILVVVPFLPILDQYHPYVRWLFFLVVPIVSLSSLARGYFMGKQEMSKIAFSNFLRKVFQLILLVILYRLFSFDQPTAILIALGTLIGSELLVFVYLFHAFFIQWNRSSGINTALPKKEVQQNLLSVSIPTTGMRLFHAVTHAVQPFIIKMALLRSGVPENLATEQFGLMAGVAISIGFFPGFIAHSLLISLIPSVSETYDKQDHRKLRKLLQHVMLITCSYGVPSVILFYFFAEPLTNIFFHSTSASLYLQLLWPYFLFHFFVIPLQAYLIGLGLVKDALLHAMWATVIAFGLMFVLGSFHHLQMQGVIIGMNFGAVLMTLLHYLTICKKIEVSYFLRPLINRNI